MSLNYYYSDVENADIVMFDEDSMMRSDTQSIIFSTMSVGMGEITEKNWLEFYARLNIVERLGGYNEITPQRLREHIGLRTNVTYEKRSAWLSRWFEYEIDNIQREAKRECQVGQH
jgi:hypothetical protein